MLGQSLWKTRPAHWSFSKFSPIARKENKILHSRIEAMHIQFAEKDRGSALAELVTVSGIGNNWCEGFSTYPRTYDLIHANGVFSLYQDKYFSYPYFSSVPCFIRNQSCHSAYNSIHTSTVAMLHHLSLLKLRNNKW
ncbi:hypothetical protein ERO13_D02G089000v2 [Gossypium hirsutum]|uniref:Methyltransferase n=1 Tax=Gossypium hirsutum TaxID=3635 RepID=A0ABM2ZP57_GOSHI|nr:uncharacterized protein LOC107944899 isoform X1 [Gossypium hirsutum]KAG4157856.1 hypothetical protein ERO13_D02G089000v2 [Gossypium hirsutum]